MWRPRPNCPREDPRQFSSSRLRSRWSKWGRGSSPALRPWPARAPPTPWRGRPSLRSCSGTSFSHRQFRGHISTRGRPPCPRPWTPPAPRSRSRRPGPPRRSGATGARCPWSPDKATARTSLSRSDASDLMRTKFTRRWRSRFPLRFMKHFKHQMKELESRLTETWRGKRALDHDSRVSLCENNV